MFVIPDDVAAFLNQLSLPEGPIVVGVSGGADSLYLTYLLAQWAKKQKKSLWAVTVNHNLRPESAKEALWVHKQLTTYHIQHEILSWEGAKPKTHIEEKAREKRYELLLDFCRRKKAPALFLAHHQQDQAETFWIRLAHSSGLDGLCAMAPISKRANLMIVRPLLNTPKTTILSALKKNHFKWVEDPMNQDTAYERIRWRRAQADFDKLGLTGNVISKTSARLARAKEALDFYTQEFIKQHIKKSPYGFVFIEENKFSNLPTEIRVRTLLYILNLFNQKKKILSLESVEKIALNMPKHATLAGCQWVISGHKIFVAPELKTLEQMIVPANKWSSWGGCTLYTNKPFQAKASAPTPRMKGIPFLIQRTFLKIPKNYRTILVNSEKELEKKAKMDYKDNMSVLIMQFNKQKDNTCKNQKDSAAVF